MGWLISRLIDLVSIHVPFLQAASMSRDDDAKVKDWQIVSDTVGLVKADPRRGR